jgi:hypothetical protein
MSNKYRVYIEPGNDSKSTPSESATSSNRESVNVSSSISSSKELENDYTSIHSLISNPICRGFLLQFCESQYNSENLNFVSEVIRFRDIFFAVDKDLWTSNWKNIDIEVAFDEKGAYESSNIWPSAVCITAARSHIEWILNEYVLDHAHHQVCISKCFILNMKKRINLLHLYGPHVFEEACLGIYIYVYMYIHIYIFIYICLYIIIWMYMYIYVYIYIYIIIIITFRCVYMCI